MTQPEPVKNTPSGPSTETLAARHDRARAILERGAQAAKHALALDLLEKVHDPIGEYPYKGWETLYREQWKYDSFGRTTHSINCTGSCTWKVYVRNNIGQCPNLYRIIKNKKLLPTPLMICQTFNHCRSFTFCQLIHKIPIKMKKFKSIYESWFLFRKAFCFSN